MKDRESAVAERSSVYHSDSYSPHILDLRLLRPSLLWSHLGGVNCWVWQSTLPSAVLLLWSPCLAYSWWSIAPNWLSPSLYKPGRENLHFLQRKCRFGHVGVYREKTGSSHHFYIFLLSARICKGGSSSCESRGSRILWCRSQSCRIYRSPID